MVVVSCAAPAAKRSSSLTTSTLGFSLASPHLPVAILLHDRHNRSPGIARRESLTKGPNSSVSLQVLGLLSLDLLRLHILLVAYLIYFPQHLL